jgi:phosphomannomutase
MQAQLNHAYAQPALVEIYKTLPIALNISEISVEFVNSWTFKVIDEIRDRLYDQRDHWVPIEISEADGVRVSCKDGWWLARASQTQAAIIVRCESQTKDTLEDLKSIMRFQLEASGLYVDFNSPPVKPSLC